MSGAVRKMAGEAVYVCAAEGPKLDGEPAAADLVGEAIGLGASMIAVPVERLGEGFLTLRTRIAGEVIQKLVNYGLRLAVVATFPGPSPPARRCGTSCVSAAVDGTSGSSRTWRRWRRGWPPRPDRRRRVTRCGGPPSWVGNRTEGGACATGIDIWRA